MPEKTTQILDSVASYYTDKLKTHGAVPAGVDWNGEASQHLRFEQLCRIIEPGHTDFSITDFGCGYGALLQYLQGRFDQFSYLGVDVSQEMVHTAQQAHAHAGTQARFVVAAEPDSVSDYCVASGVFNVRLEHNDEEWLAYLLTTLDVLDRSSSRGFAFNCLTSYSDADKMRDYLYYADPCLLFDVCKRQYSRQVALLHDYGLYEFTILVRKS